MLPSHTLTQRPCQSAGCRQVTSRSSSCLSAMLLLLLLLLLLLPNILSVLLLHQLPSSSSSHSLNLTHLTHLHLVSPLPLLSRLVPIARLVTAPWLSCLYQLPSNPLQLLCRRVRVSGRGHEIVNPRIVYSSHPVYSLFSPLPSSPNLPSPTPVRDLPACLIAWLSVCLCCAARPPPVNTSAQRSTPDQTRPSGATARSLARSPHIHSRPQATRPVCLAPAFLAEINPRTILSQALWATTLGRSSSPPCRLPTCPTLLPPPTQMLLPPRAMTLVCQIPIPMLPFYVASCDSMQCCFLLLGPNLSRKPYANIALYGRLIRDFHMSRGLHYYSQHQDSDCKFPSSED